jgi:hypothetical protein
MTLLDSLAVGLAAYRLAVLIVLEDGPFDVALAVRRLAGVETPGPQGVLAKMMSCLWCAGTWATLLCAGLWLLEPAAVYVLAAMAVVVVLDGARRS